LYGNEKGHFSNYEPMEQIESGHLDLSRRDRFLKEYICFLPRPAEYESPKPSLRQKFYFNQHTTGCWRDFTLGGG
jgi:hypothetical protein